MPITQFSHADEIERVDELPGYHPKHDRWKLLDPETGMYVIGAQEQDTYGYLPLGRAECLAGLVCPARDPRYCKDAQPGRQYRLLEFSGRKYVDHGPPLSYQEYEK